MDQGLNGLLLAHALPQDNGIRCPVIVAVGTALNGSKGDGNLRRSVQRFDKAVILRHFSGEGVHSQAGQLFPLGVGIVEYAHNLKGHPLDLSFLGHGMSCAVSHDFFCVGVTEFPFHCFGIGHRRIDFDTVSAFLHVSSELFPVSEGADQTGLRALHGNEDGVVHAVCGESGHDLQVFLILFALEDCLYAFLQGLGGKVQILLPVLRPLLSLFFRIVGHCTPPL